MEPVSDRFNRLLETQKQRLTSVYLGKGITAEQIDMVIDHSYYMLNEVSRTTLDQLEEVQKTQIRILSIARFLIGLIVSVFVGLSITILSKYVGR